MEYIDHIFFINLEHRKDRLEQITEELQTMGITNAERFSAISTPGFGILGCTQSHCEVMKIARDRKYKNVLILEDDLHFVVDAPTLDKEIRQIFEHTTTTPPTTFDVVQFAYNLHSYEPCPEMPFLWKALFSQTASCYLVNGPYLNTLIELYEHAIPLLKNTHAHWLYANDIVWKVLMERDRWYVTKTRCGVQRPSFSDNSGVFQDYGV